MAFPTVESITVYNGGTSQVSPHPIVMPATVNAGDLLIILFNMESGSSPTEPSGWVTIFGPTEGPNAACFTVGYARVADGTEDGSTVNIDTTSTSFGIAHTYRISGWHGTIATGISVGTPATGNDTAANPPTVTASWGSADNLFIAWAAYYDDENTSAAPTNYTNLQYNECASSLAIPSIASARRELASDTDNPGGFTNETGEWTTETIVIRPAGGTSVTPDPVVVNVPVVAPSEALGITPSSVVVNVLVVAPTTTTGYIPNPTVVEVPVVSPALSLSLTMTPVVVNVLVVPPTTSIISFEPNEVWVETWDTQEP